MSGGLMSSELMSGGLMSGRLMSGRLMSGELQLSARPHSSCARRCLLVLVLAELHVYLPITYMDHVTATSVLPFSRSPCAEGTPWEGDTLGRGHHGHVESSVQEVTGLDTIIRMSLL